VTLPSYSVVVPCYNAERFIEDTVRSALDQSHPPLEIIVVDDGSTDRSAALASACSPVVRVSHQPNSGESVARNRGMAQARGEWVALLDADDIWRPEKMRRQLDLVAESPAIVAVHSWFEYFGALQGVPPLPEDIALPKLAAVVKEVRFHPSTLIVRRDVDVRFEESTKMGEDTLFFLSLLSRYPSQIAFCPDALVGYRKHASQQTLVQGHFAKKLEALAHWTDSDPCATDSGRREVRDAITELAISGLALCKAKRDWRTYDDLRTFLTDRMKVPTARVQEAVGRRFPRWVYTVWDRLAD
jgi:glycosyltransferase involved in cell wall biosynthesis